MARVDQKDVVRTAEADEPSPNEVSGYYKRDEDDPSRLTDEWVDPVDPEELDPDVHVAIVPNAERDAANQIAVPLAEASPARD